MAYAQCQMLKNRVVHKTLEQFLRPYYAQLIERTINTEKLVKILHEKGVLSQKEMDKCLAKSKIVDKNVKLYKIVMEKNIPREKLIYAFEKTGNFRVLQLLHSDRSVISPIQEVTEERSYINRPDLDIAASSYFQEEFVAHRLAFQKYMTKQTNLSATPKRPLNSRRISILKSVVKIKDTPSNKWTETIGAQNFSRIEEDDFDWTLARVATACNDDSGIDSRFYFTPEEFHRYDGQAIIKFIESQLDLDEENKSLGREPIEIYINTLYFSCEDWTWLSKFLSDFCRDSLENLWLDGVYYKEFSVGTQWLRTLPEHEKLKLQFKKLKQFIFQQADECCTREMVYNILKLIQPVHFALADFWNNSHCQAQIWANDVCHILIDPTEGTLYFAESQIDFKDEIGNLFGQRETGQNTDKKRAPIVKMYQHLPRADLFKEEINQRFLNHLYLVGVDSFQLLKDVMNNLPRFEILEKLGLSVNQTWPIDLKPLDVLEKLSFVYLEGFAVNSGGFGVDLFPWKPSVKTIILPKCSIKMKTPDLRSTVSDQDCVILQPGRRQEVREKILPCTIRKITGEETKIAVLQEFFN